MSELRIAASTGEVDKRTINGNNGTSRGEDKKTRKRPTGYYVLKDEVRAGLRARLEIVIDHFGGVTNTAKRLKVSRQIVEGWVDRGMISADGAWKVQKDYRRNGCVGFRATYCRPDLRFDGNGKPKTTKCDKRHMMRVVKESDLPFKPENKERRNQIKAQKAKQ